MSNQMSNRLSSSDSSPSPPKSRSPGRRRPLQVRSDSENNETPPRLGRAGDSAWHEGVQGRAPPDDDKVYITSPFPTLESQILRPRTTPHRSPFGISNSALYNQPNDSTTSTPVLLEQGSSSPPSDLHSGDSFTRSSHITHTQERPIFAPGLITPSSTIRLVTEDEGDSPLEPITDSPIYQFQPSPPALEDSPDWPLPTLPARSVQPATPTPAQRVYRPTIRAISQLTSEATARLTPGSARSANSSGTQVHRTRVDTEELPDGSYLHFADRRERRSLSEPDFYSSSPIVHTLQSSSPAATNFQTIGNNYDDDDEEEEGVDIRDSSPPNHFSFRRNSSGFPALRRYLEVAEAGSRSPTASSEQSSSIPSSSPGLGRSRPSPRNQAFRWSSLMSLSTIPSQPEGTTAPSSIRVISTEPSNLFDEIENSQFTENTAQSSIRFVPASRSNQFVDPDISALTQDSTVQSSIRLVSPDPSLSIYDGDTSALTFQTQQSIRLVGQSPSMDDSSSRYSLREVEATPTRDRPHNLASSPAWVSYSSPVQLPHIPYEAETEIGSTYLTPGASPHPSQLDPPVIGTSPSPSNYGQDAAVSMQSSPATVASYRRRSIRLPSQTSPFFHGSSGRANLKQSTIGQSFDQETLTNPSVYHAGPSAITSGFDQSMLDPVDETSSAGTKLQNFEDGSFRRAASTSIDESSILGPLRFPAASSSIDNTPSSIHIPRNRPLPDRISRISHIRARTLGSTSSAGTRSTASFPPKSPRRSSSPVLPHEYPAPTTPPNVPARPSNPTPGVTPGVTPAKDRRVRQVYEPVLPDIDPATGAEPISYPSVAYSASHLQIPGRVGHRDFSPHLWHGAGQAINRRSIFRPPSVDEIQFSFLSGAKTRRDIQIACFALGFLLPILWMIASFLPLPHRGNLGLVGSQDKSWKGKGVIGDPEKYDGFDGFSADEVAGFESARWWRGLNRCLSFLGIILITTWIVLGVITSEGGIQGPLQV